MGGIAPRVQVLTSASHCLAATYSQPVGLVVSACRGLCSNLYPGEELPHGQYVALFNTQAALGIIVHHGLVDLIDARFYQ